MNLTAKILAKGTKVTNYNAYRSKSKTTAEYCLETVRQYDYENFVATLLLKDSARSTALAVRSFNVEIARIAEQTSQETTGLMRLQFWKDTISKCFSKDENKVPQHPVALELFKAISASNLTKRYFDTLLKCRSDNMNLNTFRTLEDMEKYSENSVCPVYYLILEGCGVKDLNADHAASHLGKAHGLVQLLRSAVHARKLNMIPLPQDLLIQKSISQESILRSKNSNELSDCTFEVASRAFIHLKKARNLMNKVPDRGKNALLPAVTLDFYLDKLQKLDYDLFHPSLKQKPLFWIPKLWWTSIKKQY